MCALRRGRATLCAHARRYRCLECPGTVRPYGVLGVLSIYLVVLPGNESKKNNNPENRTSSTRVRYTGYVYTRYTGHSCSHSALRRSSSDRQTNRVVRATGARSGQTVLLCAELRAENRRTAQPRAPCRAAVVAVAVAAATETAQSAAGAAAGAEAETGGAGGIARVAMMNDGRETGLGEKRRGGHASSAMWRTLPAAVRCRRRLQLTVPSVLLRSTRAPSRWTWRHW